MSHAVKLRKLRWSEHVAREVKINAYRILKGYFRTKQFLVSRRPWQCKWNIKIDVGEMGCLKVNLFELRIVSNIVLPKLTTLKRLFLLSDSYLLTQLNVTCKVFSRVSCY
jgi:hypothetical protein